jgi:hypothetical protein
MHREMTDKSLDVLLDQRPFLQRPLTNVEATIWIEANAHSVASEAVIAFARRCPDR